MTWSEEVGLFLMVSRKKSKFTQNQVADATSRTKGTVSNWELGKVEPDPATKDKLAELLGIPRARLDTPSSQAQSSFPELSSKKFETPAAYGGINDPATVPTIGTIRASTDGLWGEVTLTNTAGTILDTFCLRIADDMFAPQCAPGEYLRCNGRVPVISGMRVIAQVPDPSGDQRDYGQPATRHVYGLAEISRGQHWLRSLDGQELIELGTSPEWAAVVAVVFNLAMMD